MRWVTAVRGCFSNGSIVGAGNARRAEAPRQDGVGIPARGSGAVCPSRRVDSRRLVLRRVAERWTGQILNSGVGPKTSMPVHSCANSASCARIAASENL